MTGAVPADRNLFARLTKIICRFRWISLALLAGCTAFFVWQIQGLSFDNSKEIWFVEGDPSLERIREFKRLFGNDDFIYFVFDSAKTFSPEGLRTLDDLAADLKVNVPYVRDVTWLGNAEYIENQGDTLIIDDFFAPHSFAARDMNTMKRRALAEKMYRNSLIADDAGSLGLVMEMDAYPEGAVDPRSEITLSVREILKKDVYKGLGPYMVGQPVLHHDYNLLSLTESRFFFGLCLLIQMVLLYGLAKGFRGVFVPLAVVFLSVLWTLGMIHVLGYTLNLFIIIVPTLLVCISIGDSMHLISAYNRVRETSESAWAAMVQAIGEVGFPCLLSTITTAAGFLAFNVADIRPFREMGVYASIGTVMAFVLSIVLVPLAYAGFSRSRGKQEQRRVFAAGGTDFFDALFDRIYRINVAAPRSIITLFLILLTLGAYGYSRVEVETNTARMLSTDLPLRQAYDAVDERMGGSMAVEIMLDTGKHDGIKDPLFLHRMELLQSELDKLPNVTKTVSVIDILKRINQAMHQGRETSHVLPESRGEVAQYMLLYEMSDGREMDKVVSFKNDVARLTAKTKTLGTKQVRSLSDRVDSLSRELFGSAVKVVTAGHLSWVRSMNDLLGQGQRKSFLTAIVVISLIIAVSLRSLRLGLVSIIPNVFPVIVTLGFMGFQGLYMDMPLMSFSAIIIGVAVDDTIHFLFRFREEFGQYGSYELALKRTLQAAGRPLTFTTLTLAAGFGVLMFSDLTGVSKFGGLAGFAFIWALLADFFFVPSLLLVFRPLGPETVSQLQAS